MVIGIFSISYSELESLCLCPGKQLKRQNFTTNTAKETTTPEHNKRIAWEMNRILW